MRALTDPESTSDMLKRAQNLINPDFKKSSSALYPGEGYDSRIADKFVCRLPDDIHSQITIQAAHQLLSANAWLVTAVLEKLDPEARQDAMISSLQIALSQVNPEFDLANRPRMPSVRIIDRSIANKFVVRMPMGMRDAVAACAKDLSMSMNSWLVLACAEKINRYQWHEALLNELIAANVHRRN